MDIQQQFQALADLGAGDFQHLNGSLASHLKATQALLDQWGASSVVSTAGLFHAAYGTAGFEQHMVSLAQRQHIATIIGREAEALVYLYCSCDRSKVFPTLGQHDEIQFKDRFTGDEFVLCALQAQQFCELTAANELELVMASASFRAQYGEAIFSLLTSMTPFLSEKAQQALESCQNR